MTTPTKVALYELISGRWECSAVFSLDTAVTLTTFGDAECPQASDWLANGVPLLRNGTRVPAADGPAFMRALLQPFRSTYSRLIDESAGTDPA